MNPRNIIQLWNEYALSLDVCACVRVKKGLNYVNEEGNCELEDKDKEL